MQNAPSVVYPVGRSAWMGWICLLLGLAILGAGLLASMTMNPSPAAVVAWLLPWLLWCGWAWQRWRRSPGGWLRWHGQGGSLPGRASGHWRWHTDRADAGVELVSVEPLLDLQSGWLLRLGAPAGVPRWVCVQADDDPPNWPALRRALTAARQAR